MEIRIESLIEGARRAEGAVVVIDVFRAFTTAAVAFARGVETIILTAKPEEALALRDRGLGDLCMGEVNGIRAVGFDFGNSPFELSQADVRGKTLIQSTRAGTVGVCAVPNPQTLYAASFVVAGATARAILHDDPPLVTLVAMGAKAWQRSDEDEQCALYLRNLLLGGRPDPDAVRKLVADSADAAKFRNPELPHFHPGDLEIALDIDRYDFAIRVTTEDGLPVARAVGGQAGRAQPVDAAQPDAQLQMVWPEHLLSAPPAAPLPPGYALRTYRPGDEQRFYEVMALAGWPGWDDEKLRPWLARIPPGSWFMVVYEASGQIVATAMGLHDHSDAHPFGGELGWVACDPAHTGKGLGSAVSAAVTTRLIAAGYRAVHLYTERWRLAALKSYLKLGYIPFLSTPEMAERWRAVCAQLGWPFTPEAWRR
jgi:phosphosulfolactate phosphohydrolase-like enzyme/GNAT superfamily N-acetyltransferase